MVVVLMPPAAGGTGVSVGGTGVYVGKGGTGVCVGKAGRVEVGKGVSVGKDVAVDVGKGVSVGKDVAVDVGGGANVPVGIGEDVMVTVGVSVLVSLAVIVCSTANSNLRSNSAVPATIVDAISIWLACSSTAAFATSSGEGPQEDIITHARMVTAPAYFIVSTAKAFVLKLYTRSQRVGKHRLF